MKYMVAVDGSAVSQKALDLCIQFMNRDVDELIIVSVANPEINMLFGVDDNPEIIKRATDKHQARWWNMFHAKRSGVQIVSAQLLFVKPREKIVEAAEKEAVENLIGEHVDWEQCKDFFLGTSVIM